MSQPTDPYSMTTDVRSLGGAANSTPPSDAAVSGADRARSASSESLAPSSLSESAAPVSAGDIIADKYRIERVLGQGGVGVVVAALHLRLQHRVAIKFLLPNAPAEAISRFSREAQSAMKLKSEHATKVLDVGELPNGAPYMVLEYLEGSDLAEHLTWQGPLPIEEAMEYVLQTCEAMAEAHAAGIIHRDLKPANLFLTKTGGRKMIKVLDFGISKDSTDAGTGAPAMSLTRTTSVFGSPLYMPPEQMRSTRDVDARSDIWSLGVIIYELLTGRPPFDSELYPDLVVKITVEPAPPPSQFRRDIPAKLEAAILRCLEKKPADRFQDVAKLAVAIAPFANPSARGSVDRIKKTLESAPIPALAHENGTARAGGAASAKTDGIGRSGSKSTSRSGLLWKVVLATVLGSMALVLLVAGLLGVFKEPEGSKGAVSISPASEPEKNSIGSTSSPQAPTPPPIGVTLGGEASTPLPKPVGPVNPVGVIPSARPSSSALPVGSPPQPTVSAVSPPPAAPPSESPSAPPPPTATQVVTTPPPPPPPPPKKNPLDMEIK